MHRLFVLFLLSLSAVGTYACGGTPPSVAPPPSTPAGAALAETCPLVDAGPPPVCPDGCVWNGTECRRQGGIIIFDRPKK